jgi:hypothetical protein
VERHCEPMYRHDNRHVSSINMNLVADVNRWLDTLAFGTYPQSIYFFRQPCLALVTLESFPGLAFLSSISTLIICKPIKPVRKALRMQLPLMRRDSRQGRRRRTVVEILMPSLCTKNFGAHEFPVWRCVLLG